MALPFADELFFLAHDDRTGKPRLSERVMGLVLAAGLLGELLVAGRVAITELVVAVTEAPPPAEGLTRAVHETMAAQPGGSTIRTWLNVFGEQARESIGQRLLQSGLVEVERSRWPGWPPTRFVPLSSNTAYAAAARLQVQLGADIDMPDDDVLLAGLAVAGLLGKHLVPGGRRRQEQVLTLVRGLPPGHQQLVTQLERSIVEGSMVRH